jgi:hypothetical protein
VQKLPGVASLLLRARRQFRFGICPRFPHRKILRAAQIFLALQRGDAVKAQAAFQKFFYGMKIVVDGENQL